MKKKSAYYKILLLPAVLLAACQPPQQEQNSPGALPGLFSVGAMTQVQFAQGNLQYHAGTDTWQFAANQYDYNPSEGRVDLFAYADWSVHAISNGGNKAKLWRALTRDEWVYLFHERTDAANLFGLATVNGIKGAILLPDTWTTPKDLSFAPGTAKGLEWNGLQYQDMGKDHYLDNSYTAAEWLKMEKAGAVFLPAAGYREGERVLHVGSYGAYWSATPEDPTDVWYVYYLNFYSHYLCPEDSYTANLGHSVRLVTAYAAPR